MIKNIEAFWKWYIGGGFIIVAAFVDGWSDRNRRDEDDDEGWDEF